MKTAAIVSYQLKNSVIEYINDLAKKLHLSRGKCIEYLVQRMQRMEAKNRLLKAYFAMAKDRDFLTDQLRDAESDLLSESKVSS